MLTWYSCKLLSHQFRTNWQWKAIINITVKSIVWIIWKKSLTNFTISWRLQFNYRKHKKTINTRLNFNIEWTNIISLVTVIYTSSINDILSSQIWFLWIHIFLYALVELAIWFILWFLKYFHSNFSHTYMQNKHQINFALTSKK